MNRRPLRATRQVDTPKLLPLVFFHAFVDFAVAVLKLFCLSFHRCDPSCNFRFDGFKIEARSPLHWRELDKGLRFLANHLLQDAAIAVVTGGNVMELLIVAAAVSDLVQVWRRIAQTPAVLSLDGE